MTVYRVTDQAYVASPLDGEGARLHGGRWNSKGLALAYTSQNLSLAMLEILVNLEDESVFDAFVFFEVQVPDELIAVPGTTPGVPAIPTDWNQGNRVLARNYGDRWAKNGSSLALRVPSAVNPIEANILINVRHADFARVTIGASQPLDLDPRLLSR